jgi:hypothetical protein
VAIGDYIDDDKAVRAALVELVPELARFKPRERTAHDENRLDITSCCLASWPTGTREPSLGLGWGIKASPRRLGASRLDGLAPSDTLVRDPRRSTKIWPRGPEVR